MKALAIQGSPNQDGLTAKLCHNMLVGIASRAADIELIHLNEWNIKQCLACRRGWGVCWDGDQCIQCNDDDTSLLYQKMIEADILILATPVYFRDLSESMKQFLDRIRRLEWPQAAEHKLTGKVTAFIAAAGGSGVGAPEALSSFSEYNNYLKLDDVYYLPVRRQNKEIQLDIAFTVGEFLVDHFNSKV